MKQLFHTADESSRRQFIGNAARGLLGVSAMPVLARAMDSGVTLRPATARNVIYLFMRGGMSHLDTFDTKPGTENQGPIESIDTNVDGIQVSQHFPNVARQMDKIAVLNSLQSTQGAHAQGQYYMHTSYELRGTIKHPSLGAWLHRMAGKGHPMLPGSVVISGGSDAPGAGFLPSTYMPLPIGDPNAGLQHSVRPNSVDLEAYDRRLQRLRAMNSAFAAKYDNSAIRAYSDVYDEAVRLMDSKDLAAFDLNDEPEPLRDAYGESDFGQGCLLARRLVEHGIRFVEVVSNGWDTHDQNFERLGELCPDLDQGLAALLADLNSRGMLEDTLVVLATEFGRSPEIVAARSGRNHYPKAFTCLLAGGGVRGGQRYGRTDPTGQEIVENRVSVPDFNATIAHALGLPLDQVITSASGRPFTVADKGRPVTALFG